MTTILMLKIDEHLFAGTVHLYFWIWPCRSPLLIRPVYNVSFACYNVVYKSIVSNPTFHGVIKTLYFLLKHWHLSFNNIFIDQFHITRFHFIPISFRFKLF